MTSSLPILAQSLRSARYLTLLFLILTGGCAKTVGPLQWDTMALFSKKETYMNPIDWSKVQAGDILVRECDGGPLGWFGHCGIVTSESSVAEIPKLCTVVYYDSLESWKDARRVAVLRLQGMDDHFRDTVLENIRESMGRPYFFMPKKSQRATYCSSYVWSIFYHTGQGLGRHVDIDSNHGLLAMPWDFVGDDDLEIVDVME